MIVRVMRRRRGRVVVGVDGDIFLNAAEGNFERFLRLFFNDFRFFL